VLPSFQAPTLVLHSRDAQFIPPEGSRFVADQIRGARYLEIEGGDILPFGVAGDEVMDEVEEFITGAKPARPSDRVLATVLFTDIVRSTEHLADVGDRRWKDRLDLHDRVVRAKVEANGGRFVSSTGDGVVASFDLPGRAIRCAAELGDALSASAIEIRCGIHTGEIELREDGNIAGIATHVAARVMAEAVGGQVLCTRTVKDLTAGAGFAFEELGSRTLKGVPDEWQLFAVT
jgi:class 3 adenylate cyclase